MTGNASNNAKYLRAVQIEARHLAEELRALENIADVYEVTKDETYVAERLLSTLGTMKSTLSRLQFPAVCWAQQNASLGTRPTSRLTGLSTRTVNTWLNKTDERERSEAVLTFTALALDAGQDQGQAQ